MEKFDARSYVELEAERKRQKKEIIERCLSDVKNGVVMMQDAVSSSSNISNQILFNLLEEPLSKIFEAQKILGLNATQYDEMKKQFGYFEDYRRALENAPALLMRMSNIVDAFNNILSVPCEMSVGDVLRDEAVDRMGNEECDVSELVGMGLDVNEIFDCSERLNKNIWLSVFGCALMSKNRKAIRSCIDNGAKMQSPFGFSGEEVYYPIEVIFHFDEFDVDYFDFLIECGCTANDVAFVKNDHIIYAADVALHRFPRFRKLHKLFKGCKCDEGLLIRDLMKPIDDKSCGNYEAYICKKNMLLFLIDGKVDIISIFYDSQSLFKGMSFKATVFGSFVLNFYCNSTNPEIKSDVKNIIDKIGIDLDFIALKTVKEELRYKDLI